MTAIEAAVEHYRSLGTKFIDVPEWGEPDKPFRVYWKPLTVGERGKLLRDGLDGKGSDADVLIMKALDGDGKKLFTIEHKEPLLRETDATVVTRIASAILGHIGPEELEKNSAAIPSG